MIEKPLFLFGAPKGKGGGGDTVTKRVVGGRTPEGTRFYRNLEVHAGQPPSMDELPPPGVGGPLTKEPPKTLGGVTSEQLDKSAANGEAGIDRSQPTGDKK